MTIPKVIHQTWKDLNIPTQFIPFVESWKSHHPGWRHILWTDGMNRKFVADHFPGFLSTYDSYPYNIQRADAIRYLLLYELGGVYVDLDVECLQNVEPLISDEASFYVAKEPAEHCEKYREEMILCNGWMASVVQQEFLRAVIEELQKGNSIQETISRQTLGELVLNSTGPFMLNRVFRHTQDKTSIRLLDHKRIHPLSRDAAWQLYTSENAAEQKAALRSQGTYAVHYFWGTWAPGACRRIRPSTT